MTVLLDPKTIEAADLVSHIRDISERLEVISDRLLDLELATEQISGLLSTPITEVLSKTVAGLLQQHPS